MAGIQPRIRLMLDSLQVIKVIRNISGSAKDELPKVLRENILGIFPALLLVLQVAMFFASSLVEEEHDVQ